MMYQGIFILGIIVHLQGGGTVVVPWATYRSYQVCMGWKEIYQPHEKRTLTCYQQRNI